MKPRVNKRKEIMTIKVKMSERENIKIIDNIDETKS